MLRRPRSFAWAIALALGCRSGDEAPARASAQDPSGRPAWATPEAVEFPSDGRMLHGYLYRPPGEGPFAALVFNHGSEADPGDKYGQALFYVPHGFVLFVPHRRGHGRSGPPEQHVQALMAAAGDEASQVMVEQLDAQATDVEAAVQYVKTLPFVDPGRIAVAGCSFGGIESLFAAERDLGIVGAIDFAGGAITWRDHPLLRERMKRAARDAKVPVFFVQAENDYDTAPSIELAAEMARADKPHHVRIFPPNGTSKDDGHAFCIGGDNPGWGPDVLEFLGSVMPPPSTPSDPAKPGTAARSPG